MTTLFIPPEAFGERAAGNRALAYLAHGQPLLEPGLLLHPWCGPWFGTVYDIVTVLLLSFAGTSVMTALAGLLPQFLLRFGMDFRWSQRWGVLLIAFALINLAVTVYFRASVEAQRNAYATGVIVLIVAASASSWLDLRKSWKAQRGFFRGLGVLYLWIVTVGFTLIGLVILWHAGGGLMIAAGFIAAILALVGRVARLPGRRTADDRLPLRGRGVEVPVGLAVPRRLPDPGPAPARPPIARREGAGDARRSMIWRRTSTSSSSRSSSTTRATSSSSSTSR